jgi:hypothetical protein
MINGKGGEPIALFNVRFVHASLPDLEQSLCLKSLRWRAPYLLQYRSQPNQVFETDALNLSHIAALDAFGLSSLGHDFGCTKEDK